ncbi:MAG: FliM/FliN family flagellar motor switch protein [Candidatus Gastranaerophilaceae bacterium]
MTADFNTTTKEILERFDWYSQTFDGAVQSASNDFLLDGLSVKLVSVSKNMNALFLEESYFVTKIKVDPQNEVYLRSSDKAVKIILERALGSSKKPFVLNKITELEAKIITGFNDNLYNFVCSNFIKGNGQNRKIDVTHLTFFIKDNETFECGKVILTVPSPLLNPIPIEIHEEKFSLDFFNKSLVEVDLKIGTTAFSVGDLKCLEPEDIVVLDNSNIQTMRLLYKGYEKEFRIAPNPAIIMSVDSDGGEEMASNMPPENLWDSIQVEMGAEFDKVKISLGELKNIEQGLVVDLASVYSNNITLKVEEKVIATGELVIVNDRYGVKINKIFAEPKSQPQQQVQEEVYNQEEVQEEGQEQIGESIGEPVGMEEMPENSDGELDYSDFELEDEDL